VRSLIKLSALANIAM